MTTNPETDSVDIADRRWRLVDRLEFLRRSLDDLAREREAGDVSDEDFKLLEARDSSRLAEVEAALDALGGQEEGSDEEEIEAEAAKNPTRRRRPMFAIAGVVVLAIGVVVLVVDDATTRLPGQTLSGTVQVSKGESRSEELAQAATLIGEGKNTTALQVYDGVLSTDPNQPDALAGAGWLDWEIGSTGKGIAAMARDGEGLVSKSIRLAPNDALAHLYLGYIDEDDGMAQAAVVQFNHFLADHPTPATVRQAASSIRKAYSATKQTLPPGV